MRTSRAAVLALASLLAAAAGCVQQEADSSFDASVERPAYVASHPRVLIDEAHHNFHTLKGRYAPFARLLSNDGYRVTAQREPFTARSLAQGEVLVIANASGADSDAAPAFTAAECAAVLAWVRSGGALLLVADHAPFGSAAATLGARFGVDMSKGYTADTVHTVPGTSMLGLIEYSRANGLLAEHPITMGRGPEERVSRVLVFTGQSLKGPKGSVALLALARTAEDLVLSDQDRSVVSRSSAAGRSQGIAMRAGKGRVVVLAEAAMLSAQAIYEPGPLGARRLVTRMGMNWPGTDNKQFALNLLHWLSGLPD